jgi:hypothetical protein
MLRRLAIALAATVVLALPAAAHANRFLPPSGKVFWGGQGGYTSGKIADFATQSGKHAAVFNYFISWRASDSDMHWLGFRLDDAIAQRARPLLSVSPNGTGLTPRSIAQGKGDRFLVRLNGLIAEKNTVTYVRPMSEMNNGNNSYSAYRLNGRSRGAAYATGQFKKAWRRTALILRGGDVAAIDARLKKLKLPKLNVGAAALPKAPVALAWVPLTFGNPEIAKNHPKHWWPGSAYVDWAGTTWYSPFKATKAIGRFYAYKAWRRKPFVFAEWGVWGAEDPGFVNTFFGFLKSHKRVRMAVYFQSANLKAAFRLSAHPRSRAALRRAVRWKRLTGVAPEFASG